MSRTRAYKPETIATIQRFYEALDTLIATKRIRGIQTYCNRYGINKRNLYAQRQDLTRGFFEVYWIIPLVQDFGISADWLLLGVGEMGYNSKS